MKDPITKLMDDIEKILKRDHKSIADLARELNLSYHQVYDWVKRRHFAPRADRVIQLQQWRDLNRFEIQPAASSVGDGG